MFYASSAGCLKGKSCPFLHQNDSVTKKPLPADPADVQRLKGKPQLVLKPANSGTSNPTTTTPAVSSGATSSTTLAPQVSMVRVDRGQLEPEPEPIRRHPVAEWRPHLGPTREKHLKLLLPTTEPVVPMNPHMAGQHFEHIVFGANQYACWLRCTLCERTSRRILYRYTICMKCPERRSDDYESLREISSRCVLVKWNCLLLRLFWMGTEDQRIYVAQEIRESRQRQQFVEIDDDDNMEIFHDIPEYDHHTPDDLRAEVSLLKTELEDAKRANEPADVTLARQDPYSAQGSCPNKPFEGLEQCLSWHKRIGDRLFPMYMRRMAFPISIQSFARTMTNMVFPEAEIPDHEDNRRLASGLPACLSRDSRGIREPYPGEDSTHLGRQTDPGDRRTSDWRSSTLGSHPNIGVNNSRIFRDREGASARSITWLGTVFPKRLMMSLRGTDDHHSIRSFTSRGYGWQWVKPLQAEYPAKGYFMNTRWTPRDVEALQERAREYTRQQEEQMDDWDRAFYREWTSLVSRNALAFPYPMVEPLGEEEVKLRRSWQRRSVATQEALLQAQPRLSTSSTASSSSDTGIQARYRARNPFVPGDAIPFPYQREGTLEDRTTTSESTQTTTASRTWNSYALPRGTELIRDRQTGRTRMVAIGEFIPSPTMGRPMSVSPTLISSASGPHQQMQEDQNTQQQTGIQTNPRFQRLTLER